MYNEFGWQMEANYDDGYDHEHEDDYERRYEDEDDEIINSNDPLRQGNFSFGINETSPGQTIAIIGAMLEEDKQKASLDKAEKKGWQLDTSEDVEFISMSEHLEPSTKKPTSIGGSPVLKKRPFEQWVDDVLSGKKTYDDPL